MNLDGTLKYAMKRTHFKARQMIGRSGFTEADFQDLRQELLADVLVRLPKFDGHRASAKTFVSRLIDNRIATLIEHRYARRRDPRREESSLDDWVRGENGKWARRGETMAEESAGRRTGGPGASPEKLRDLAIDLAAAAAMLPERLREIYEHFKTHGSVQEVARVTGLHRSSVYDALTQIRQRFEEAGLDSYLPHSHTNPTDSKARR